MNQLQKCLRRHQEDLVSKGHKLYSKKGRETTGPTTIEREIEYQMEMEDEQRDESLTNIIKYIIEIFINISRFSARERTRRMINKRSSSSLLELKAKRRSV